MARYEVTIRAIVEDDAEDRYDVERFVRQVIDADPEFAECLSVIAQERTR